MTLREKFSQWLNTNPTPSLRDIQCEIIADDFAIGFTKWAFRKFDMTSTIEELLQIYKKEKGL